jgi:hypothetical protein
MSAEDQEIEDEDLEPESILERWEPAGLLASIFFVSLPAVTAVILDHWAVYLLPLWAVWSIYLVLRGTGINKLAGSRLLIGTAVGLFYLIFTHQI